jgi:chromosome condensin MukBEF complex kleisin-like MukF subunit
VIVRIMGEGQYRVDDAIAERLNELDDRAMEALDRQDEAELDGYLDQMAQLVRSEGSRLPDDDLSASDAVVPPSDLTLAETAKLLSEEGFIPDLTT